MITEKNRFNHIPSMPKDPMGSLLSLWNSFKDANTIQRLTWYASDTIHHEHITSMIASGWTMQKVRWNVTSHRISLQSYLVDSYSFTRMARYNSSYRQALMPLQKIGCTFAIGHVVVIMEYARTTTTIRQRVSRTGNTLNARVATSVVKFRMDGRHQRYAPSRHG